MTEEQKPYTPPAALQMGGAVMAIVPQTFEELQRVANFVIGGGLAPSSVVKTPRTNDTPEQIAAIRAGNIAAVSTILMAGAELGMPPMAALRMMTVINGRPALFADGNISIVRKSKGADGKPVASHLRTGYVEECDYKCPFCDAPAFERPGRAWTHLLTQHPTEHETIRAGAIGGDPMPEDVFDIIPSDRSYAFFEAKRSDTGETIIERFSIADAKQAGLWDDAEIVTREVWAYDAQAGARKPTVKPVPNDSPWHCYPKRMMMWRAAGYGCRWLFADVLGGMTDEFEARSTMAASSSAAIEIMPPAPKSPPKHALPDIPAEDENQDAPAAREPLQNSDLPEGAKNEEPMDALAIVDFLDNLKARLSAELDEAGVEETFDSFDVQTVLAHDELAIEEAFAAKKARIAAIARGEK